MLRATASVLVTGASGFVGSAVASALRQSGHSVVAFVRPSSSRANLDPRDAVVGRRPQGSRLARPGDERGSLSFPRRRRLPALGAGPGRDRAQQCRGNPPRHGGGAPRRRRAHRLYEQRRDLEDFRRRPGDRGSSARGRRGDRRLQAQQGRGRAARRGHDRKRRAARRHRQSFDADRPARRQAHADRPHHRRGGLRADARLRRYRAQSGSRR